MVANVFPFPQINEILADVATGTIFRSIDMTKSFFQTCMHNDDVELMAVNVQWGLYEWVIMTIGIKNAPAIHQCQVTEVLQPYIGRICHAYINNMAIWSKSLSEHTENMSTILQALSDHKLYINLKKNKTFPSEIHFLGHWISAKGIELDEGKANCVANWPQPSVAKQVHGCLGLVCYPAAFLLKLAEQMTILNELTRKECDKVFPLWTAHHWHTFDSIKALVMLTDCLTTIGQA